MSDFFDYNSNSRSEYVEHLGINPLDFRFRDNYQRDSLTPMEALVLTVYGEARGESITEMRYVAHVILNRIAKQWRGATNVFDVAVNGSQFSSWIPNDSLGSYYWNMLNPNGSTLKEVYDVVKDVVKRRAQGINPIPGVYHFMETEYLRFNNENDQTIVRDTLPPYDARWPIGMRVVYKDDLTFLR